MLYRTEPFPVNKELLDLLVTELYERNHFYHICQIKDRFLSDSRIFCRTVQALKNDFAYGKTHSKDFWADFVISVLYQINTKVNKNMQYGLWLTEKDIVEKICAKYNSELEAYDETNGILISELNNMYLYGFETLPEKVKAI